MKTKHVPYNPYAFPAAWMDMGTQMVQQGMSLRDYFAAKALQGMLANPHGHLQADPLSGWKLTNCTEGDVAAAAYSFADTMLEERES